MPDSSAVRQRRHRHHKAGDHALCRPGCDDPRTRRPVVLRPVHLEEGLDPQAELTRLAARLIEAHARAPERADVARELRMTLQAIAEAEPAAADPMDELREMAARVS